MPLLARDGAAIPTVQVDASVCGTEDLAGRPWTLRQFGEIDEEREFTGFDGSVVTL
jgi:hypothetical protein